MRQTGSRGESQWPRLDRWLTAIETSLLGVILAAMVGLAGTQVVLRNLFDAGIIWADPMTRALLLWLALVGGFAAARQQKHIRIDLLSHYASPRVSTLLETIVAITTALVCGVIAWHGGRMVLSEMEFAELAFGSTPAWLVQSIIPLGFISIAVVYVVHGLVALKRAMVKQ